MSQTQHNDLKPWYEKAEKSNSKKKKLSFSFQEYWPQVAVIVCSTLCGFFLASSFAQSSFSFFSFFLLLLFFAFLGLSLFLMVFQLGSICSFFSKKKNPDSLFHTGLKYLRNEIATEEPRKGTPACEIALSQFVQQVRAYAMEKSYQKQVQEKNIQPSPNLAGIEPGAILKRRWNDVLDSLNEFEIYLANDPNGIIEKLIAKSPNQNMDVSQIFRDVAETFDNTWRRKGINIEQAIVTPLRATTNEALLRRLLVGPWRTCVYFARRGNGVIFSAKNINGKVTAHWESEGVNFPQEFFQIASNTELSVNERIQREMELIASDPNSPNTLFALISFITWLDLVHAAGADHTIKQGDSGLVIELRIS